MDSAPNQVAPATPVRFTMPAAAWFLWGLCVAVRVVFFARSPAAASAVEVAALAAELVAVVGVPALLGWIIRRNTERKPLVARVVFGLLFAGGAAVELGRAARELSAEKSFASDPMIGEVGQALSDEVAAAVMRHEAATRAIAVTSFFDLREIKTPSQIAERRSLATAFQAANDELTRLQIGGADFIERELARRQANADHVARAVAAYRRNSRLPLWAQLRAVDARFTEAMHAFVDLAEFNLGSWRFEPDPQHIVFDNDGALARYTSVLMEVKAVTDERASLQRRLSAN